MKTYLAHIAEDGREQTVQEHLCETGKYCSEFASQFGAEQQCRYIGELHDIGKYSDAFQSRLIGGERVDHSTAGAFESARLGADWASFCIAGHHTGLPDGGNLRTDQAGDATLFGRLKKAAAGAIPPYEANWPKISAAIEPPPGWGMDPLTDSFLIRMLYSCLVDADYLDTEHFMQNGKIERGGYDSLSKLLERLDQYIAPWWKPKNELNRLRCSILKNCIDMGSEEKGLYTLTVPTGGGKTVASVAYALHHAIKHNMQRIIYVIPYTSIIEQTADVFREIFGAENVIEHHSGMLFNAEESSDPQVYRQILSTENWDAPIIVTTAVQFFESLYASRPSKCRKLHNIANSVIIFDEAQMLPIPHLRPCVAAIGQLVAHVGVTAVLCTATQPSLGDLLMQYSGGMIATEICANTAELYQKFRRVSFRDAGELPLTKLTELLSSLPQVLCIVNTRKQAQEIFAELPREGSYHLSTLMCPAHRKTALQEIRQRLKDGLSCRVVSTSLIEAGVDVDFPAVYREMAGLDSILQAAGRCNREGKRTAEESVVTIFRCGNTLPPLIRANVGATKEALSDNADPAAPDTVARYFSALRSLKGDALDVSGVIKAFTEGLEGCSMPFTTVAQNFHLIEDASKTVYIPIGDGAKIIARIKAGEGSRALYRKAGLYGVNVYEQQYRDLLRSGDIEILSEDCAVLINLALYSSNTGLSLHAEQGKANFI